MREMWEFQSRELLWLQLKWRVCVCVGGGYKTGKHFFDVQKGR